MQVEPKHLWSLLQFNFISGETTAETSLFEYTDGKQWSDYSHQDFVPIFIDEFNQTMINKSYEVCGGSSDQYKACIFDYLATGDTSFAADTQSSNTEAESETSQIRKDICYVLGSCKFCLFLSHMMFRDYA